MTRPQTLMLCYTILPVFFASLLRAEEGGLQWEGMFGDWNDDRGYSVQQTADSGYIIAGYTYFAELMDDNVSLVKTDSYGVLEWQKSFGGGRDDRGYSVQQTSDGGYILAGYTGSYGAGSDDVYLVKTNADGDQLWQKTIGGSNSDRGNSLQRTADGGYIIAGTTYSYGAGYSDVYLVKTNAEGEPLWQRTFGGSHYDRGYSAQQTSDGGYIVAGTTDSYSVGNYDIYLVKTDAQGERLWQKTFDESSHDYGYSVQQTTDGGYIVDGYTYAGGGGVHLVKTDSDGVMLWERTFNGMDYEGADPVRQTSDGGYIVTASVDPYGYGDTDIYLVKMNANGETLWEKTFGEPGDDDRAYSIQQTIDSGYIVAGYRRVYASNHRDVYLMKVSGGTTLPIIHFVSDVSSGDESSSPVPLQVALSESSAETITVDYSVIGGTAEANDVDYILHSGTLTFVPGDRSEEIPVVIVDDALDEADETVIVTLSNPVNAALVTNTAHTYTILDDDVSSPIIAFSCVGSCGDESVNSVQLAVSLSASCTERVTVGYSIAGGTATGGGVDYSLASGTLTFSSGDTIEYIPVIIVEESLDEADENIVVALSDPVNAQLGAITTYTYTILDDDGDATEWEKTFGGSDSDGAFSVQQTFDGGFITAGYTSSYGSGGGDMYLVRTNSNGDLQWQKTFGGTFSDTARTVQQTRDGGYVIVGGTSPELGGEVYLVKTDSDGDLLWEKTFGGTFREGASSVQQTSDGGYVIVGVTESYGSLHAGISNVYLAKTNSNGDLQWQKAFGTSEADYGACVKQTSDGGYVVAGTTHQALTPYMYLIKVNSLGVLQWEKMFHGDGLASGSSVQQTADGGYIVVGDTSGLGDFDVYLVKTNADGDLLWQKTLGGSNNDYGRSVQLTTDGGFIVAGSTMSYGSGSQDVYVVKTDSEGGQMWQKTFGGVGYDDGWSIQEISDGWYIVAGSKDVYGAEAGAVYLMKVSEDVTAPTLCDMNWDGIVSIVGDVPAFVQVAYFGDDTWYEQQFPGKDPVKVGDCNGDGIVSIVGDVPCFVDCVYFGNCP